uniref:Uncharacterized protein n=1 Tax=Siphoviridae sp. ctEw721 TaxID=2825400 RepID=A0A8S5TS43_9CAUD|nr:MAG TPA: hypothetical protein [Siphoviridae sp. ctEw721]
MVLSISANSGFNKFKYSFIKIFEFFNYVSHKNVISITKRLTNVWRFVIINV